MMPSSEPCAELATRSPPVVLLTGWGSTGGIFDGLIDALGPEIPLRAASLDMSAAPQDAGADTVLEWALEGLSRELPPGAVLVGWSLGGALALCYAARFPGRVAGVACIATNPCFCACPDWDAGMPRQDFDAFRAAYRADPDAHLGRFAALQATGDIAAGAVRRALREARPDAASAALLGPALDLLADLDLRADLAAIDIPVLHVLGERDPLVPVALAQQLPALAPAASVWVAAGSAHAPFLSRPAAVAARLRDFVVSLAPRKRASAADVARTFGRAAGRYDAAAAVQRDCADTLLGLAPDLQPVQVLDLGCGTGAMLPVLGERFPQAEILAADLSIPMLIAARDRSPLGTFIAADAERLPIGDGCVDLVFSSLALQWCANFGGACMEIARVLRPGGVALLALPGPATLWELRAAWRAVDGREHVNRFAVLPEILAAVRAAGLQPEQTASELRTERHGDARAVARGLRDIGANSLDAGRRNGLAGRKTWARLEGCYAALGDGGEGLPATWELLYVVMRKPHG